MKKAGILNRELITVLAKLGHTDKIVIADCGLPIPEDTTCVDLSLTLGEPSFLTVLKAVAEDVVVEHLTFAEEIKTKNQTLHQASMEVFHDVTVNYITHEQLKSELQHVKAVIRTGEATPFANILLHAWVIF